jgi:predicted acylesterase/phospholipase RssA
MGIDPVSSNGSAYDRAAASGLMGLCFSGGGIRSATFNLGILQGLAELKLLRSFDYLSTVSGGGYVHQWFAAWISRRSFKEVEERLVPLPETGNPGSHPEPLRWLRRYSNYLTPETGLVTADTGSHSPSGCAMPSSIRSFSLLGCFSSPFCRM